MPELHVVTGALSYTGKSITRCLLARGKSVRTLTGHPNRPNPFGSALEIVPLDFDDRKGLVRSLRGATTLYNTYWVRFPRGPFTFEKAVSNTRALLAAAAEAGVRRIVHISVTKPSEDSPLAYFRGKARAERAVRDSKLSYAILRPTLIFGAEDILINNIAWLLRRFPVFAIPGTGEYRVQPVFVEDVAQLAADAGALREKMVFDVAGPEIYTFNEFVRLLRASVRSRARIVHVAPSLTLGCCGLLGMVLRDVLLTREEIAGLMANLLVSDVPPRATTRLSGWLRENTAGLGAGYSSELARHFR
jgi:NADH dehydrogenase